MITPEKISIIVCSRTPSVNPDFAANVKDTIATDYEFVWIDNSKNQYSIFSAYNKGVELSTGNILCFAHEDIRFHTPGWGKKLIAHLADESIGIAGVYGMQAIADYEDFRINSPCVVGGLIQDVRLTRQPDINFEWQCFSDIREHAISHDCVFVDGLFIAARRDMFNLIRFDDITYSGFHLYDFDICMEAIKVDKRVIVCNDILIEHFSEGVFDDTFAAVCRIARNKWKKFLPIIRGVDEASYPIILHKLQYRKKSLMQAMLQRRFYDPKDEYRKIRTIIRGDYFNLKTIIKIIRCYIADPSNPNKLKIKLVWKLIYRRIKHPIRHFNMTTKLR
jgi:glycosyltransferase involved in cell wall biosynthesis